MLQYNYTFMYDVWLAFSIVIYVVGRCLFVEVLQIVLMS